MSQTPLSAEGESTDAEPSEQRQAYQHGWAAISRLARRGFSWSGLERNTAFLNLGPAGFADVSALSGFDFDDDGRALAILDWDLDGDMDVLVGNRNGPRVRFLENRASAPGKSIELVAQGTNQAAIGALVELFLKDVRQPLVREVRAGEGYLAQSTTRLHFGLAQGTVERIVVHWPARAAEEFVGDIAPAALQLIEGSGAVQPLPAAKLVLGASLAELPIAKRAASASEPKAGRRIVLTRPVPMPTLEIKSRTGQSVSLFGVLPGGAGQGTGQALLLNVWASWCAPCVKELSDFKPIQDKLEAAGIAWLALSADEDASAAAALMERIEWPYQWGFLPALGLEVLDAMQAALLDHEAPMPLPSSFLVDAQGLLRVIYMGPIEMQQLLRDQRLLELSDERMLEASLPFPGTWWGAFEDSGIGMLEGKLLRRGLSAAAEEYSRAGYQVAEKTRAELLYDFARQSAGQGDMPGAVRFLRQTVSEDPGFFKAQFELGTLLHQAGELHAAIGAYLAALAVDDQHASTHYNLGLALLATGQLRSAQGQLEWLQSHAPDLAKALSSAIEAAGAQQQDE